MAEVELNRENKLCSLCQLPAGLFCSKCRVTPYCTADCQKNSWPKHKAVCKLNSKTPLTSSVTKVVDNDDFDQQYPFIVINGADKTTPNTLAMTVDRIVGKISLNNHGSNRNCSLIPTAVLVVVSSYDSRTCIEQLPLVHYQYTRVTQYHK
jgi:MYND finger